MTSPTSKRKSTQINVYFTFPASSSLANAYMVISCFSPDYAEWKMSTFYPPSFYTKWNAIEFMVELENNKKLYFIHLGYMPEDIVKDN